MIRDQREPDSEGSGFLARTERERSPLSYPAWFWVFSAVIILMILMRDLGTPIVPTSMLSPLIALCLVALPPVYTVGLFALLVPLSSGLQYNMLVAACVLGIVLHRVRQLRFSARSVLALLALLLVQGISYVGSSFSMSSYIEHGLIWILLWVLMADRSAGYRFNAVADAYIVGAIALGVSLVVQLTRNVDGLLFWQDSGRLGNTRDDLGVQGMISSVNPNSLSLACLVGCALLVVRFVNTHKVSTSLLPAVPLLVFGVMSQSRTFVTGVCVLAVLLVLVSRRRVVAAFSTLGVLGLGTVVLYLIVPTWVLGLRARFTDVDDVSNGRIEINELYLEAWGESLARMVHGVGLDSYRESYGLPLSAHNGLIEILVAWGLLGVLALGWFVVAIGCDVQEQDRSWRILPRLVPLLVLLIAVQASRLIGTPMHLLLLLPCYAAVCSVPVKHAPEAWPRARGVRQERASAVGKDYMASEIP